MLLSKYMARPSPPLLFISLDLRKIKLLKNFERVGLDNVWRSYKLWLNSCVRFITYALIRI